LNKPAHITALQNHTNPAWFTPSNSNGKEKDYESGFHYYGARYYWSEVLTGWLSVDPMADKYPNISPYYYCHGNPIIMIDPSGESDRKFVDYETGQFLGEIDDGVNETVRITQEDFKMLLKRRKFDDNAGDTKYTKYNEMIERYAIGKDGYNIAQTARKYAETKSADWAYNTEKGKFHPGTHKCNLFVYDVLKECGITIPGKWPPIARAWANKTNSIIGFSVVTGEPHLGDIIGASKKWKDASGHVAIVTQIDLDTGKIKTTSAGESIVTENNFGESVRKTLKWGKIVFESYAIKRAN
jgi:RHS repeat-associated protein